MKVSDLTTRQDTKKTKKRYLSSLKKIKTKQKEPMKTNENIMNMTRIFA